jgi:hypothetical protein
MRWYNPTRHPYRAKYLPGAVDRVLFVGGDFRYEQIDQDELQNSAEYLIDVAGGRWQICYGSKVTSGIFTQRHCTNPERTTIQIGVSGRNYSEVQIGAKSSKPA